MEILKFDLTKKAGKFKIMNATNGGPWHRRNHATMQRSNFEEYKAARIPYFRNHDAAIQGIYGGPYAHDISKIFRNFNADENDPASYDFACTDEAILTALDAGTNVFFRLGESAEHNVIPHGAVPPADFSKWARIAEHIIRHYNEGWADGYRLNIEYWEIWSEPDLHRDNPKKGFWTGTDEMFFDFYEIASKHLKSCFPDIKLGGPALAYDARWAERFLAEMKRRNVPMDFFSWHIYCVEPETMVGKAAIIKDLLVKNGYEKAESILNEWNYVKSWGEDFVQSVLTIQGNKGAAFVMSCISEMQKCDAVDMLMHYDTRPSVFCGAFDFYTCKPRKGYYPLMWYGKFYDMESEVRCEDAPENIYTLCGIDEKGKVLCVVTNYSDDDASPAKDIKIDFGKEGKYEIYVVDDEKDGELVEVTERLEFTIKKHSFMLIKEV